MTKNTELGIEMLRLAFKVSFIQFNPFISKVKKQDKVFTLLCGLDKDAFHVGIETLLADYNIKGDKKYTNTERQLDSIVNKYPKLNYHKNILRERVKLGRVKAKLAA